MREEQAGHRRWLQVGVWNEGAVDQTRSRHYNLPESFSTPATSKTVANSQGAVVCFPA